MLQIRSLVMGVILLVLLSGCGSGAATGSTLATTEASVTSIGEDPCGEDPACGMRDFHDRSRFFEEVASERARLERACRVNPAACATLAESHLLHPLRLPSDAARGAQLYGALCEAGDLEACWPAVWPLLERSRSAEASARAAALLDHGCALGGAEVCFTAGVERLPNGRLPHDPARAATRLSSACRLGYFPACVSWLRAGASGLVESPSPAEVDALLTVGGSDAPSESARALERSCGHRSGPGFYAPLLGALTALQPAASWSAAGAIAPGQLTAAIRRNVTCTLEGAYGDTVYGEGTSLRYVRVLGAVPGGLDVFLEWSESDGNDLVLLHAARALITPESLRVVADVPFEVDSSRGESPDSVHDTRLDVDGDGLRDVRVVFSRLVPGDLTEKFLFVSTRGSGISEMEIPHDTQAAIDGCFVPSEGTPLLLVMLTKRDAERGWSESCIALHQFPPFEQTSVVPVAFTLGPRLTGDALPALPAGGEMVLRDSVGQRTPVTPMTGTTVPPIYDEEQRRVADRDLPFTMCPEQPVFLLRGVDAQQPDQLTMQTVTDIRRAEGGTLGPALALTPGPLRCEEHE